MCTHVSTRLGMSDSSEGTEVAYTEYSFNTASQLSDAPEFTQRAEWWQGKTDDSGVATTSPATYSYSRTVGTTTMTSTVVGPNGKTTVLVSNNDTASPQYGLLMEHRVEASSAVKSKQEFFYDNPSSASASSGLQRNKVITTDDGSPANQTRVDLIYGSYGRLMTSIEFGFPVSADFKKRRRTEYSYLDTSSYITKALYHLITDITVWDAKLTNSNTDDVQVSRTAMEYDTPDTGWGIAKYELTNGCTPPGCAAPPGYDKGFVDNTVRGLATKTRHWSNATLSTADISFRHQYDIFGNEVKAEIGCCSLRRFTFSSGTAGMHYSLPLSITDGPEAGSNLVSSFAFDFNTSFLNSQTDHNNLVTSYAPDAAMRVRTITYPAGATLETFYPPDTNYSSREGLIYRSKFTYQDGTTQKIQVNNKWLDGAGRTVRAGSGVGSIPASFDAVKTTYDDLGRMRKTTNPYTTMDPDGDTVGLPQPTTYDYDALHRVTAVTLPDSSSVTTTYSGVKTTVTDTVGRQKRSENDGLGRTIKVTEMDNSKNLTQETTFDYDLNDNVVSSNQGNQTRAFKYDSLSRMTFERTPEQDATISDGAGMFWSVKYTYTSFNAIATRQDARGVITGNSYDGLNRLYNVTYNTAGTAQATASVSLIYGTVAPKKGLVEEVSQTDSLSNTPTSLFQNLS
jgi:YD repeat-containing protein